MTSLKLDAVNQMIGAVKGVRAALDAARQAGDVRQQTESMRELIRAQREVVRAAQAVAAAPADPGEDKVVGAVLLSRIGQAVAVRPADDWEALGAAALTAADANANPLPPVVTTWLEAVQPLEGLAVEAHSRAEQQGIDAMMEGFRRGAAATPGVNLHIEEVVNGQTVHEETVLGPRFGDEDGADSGTSYLTDSKAAVLGIDDDRLDVDVERVNRLQGGLVLQRHSLPADATPDQVRQAVATRLFRQMDRDFSVSIALTGDLPTPVQGLSTSAFPALRAQLLRQHQLVMTEGSIYSRAKQGDRSAKAMLDQFVILGDVLAAAEPYYLPVGQIEAVSAAAETARALPAESSFLVWHDDPLGVGGGVRVLAWVFMTDEAGTLYDLAHCITVLEDGVWEGSWCSLRSGTVAATVRSVAAALQSDGWRQAKRLRLGGEVDSPAWKRALIRSASRARSGGLHGLWTHPSGAGAA